MNRVVARASRPCESKRTGETPVPLPPRQFRGAMRAVRLRRILSPNASDRQSPGQFRRSRHRTFQETFPIHAAARGESTGRLELLGTPGDRDDGLSICAAVDKYVFIAAAPRTDGRIEL